MMNPQAQDRSASSGDDPAPKPSRRSFTADYRARVLAEYEAAPHGEKSAVLRRERIYQSQVAEWAGARDAAAEGRTYRRDHKPRSARSSASARTVKLEAENARLARQLEQTQAALDVMGKAHRLLELLSVSSSDESLQGRTTRNRP
jgi:transposase